jgi:hypothetical protein
LPSSALGSVSGELVGSFMSMPGEEVGAVSVMTIGGGEEGRHGRSF